MLTLNINIHVSNSTLPTLKKHIEIELLAIIKIKDDKALSLIILTFFKS